MDNIKLEYPVNILVEGPTGDDQSLYVAPNGCEVFMDEHQVQWVKFVPTNGYHKGDEHMLHARRCTIINKSKARKRQEFGAESGEVS